jgi:hypothetical protein
MNRPDHPRSEQPTAPAFFEAPRRYRVRDGSVPGGFGQDPWRVRGVSREGISMRRNQRLMSLVALSGSILIGGAATPGCSGDRTTTGTLVEKTPEQAAAEKAAMEGMRKAMSKAKGEGKAR